MTKEYYLNNFQCIQFRFSYSLYFEFGKTNKMLQHCSEIFPMQWHRINLQSKSDSNLMLKRVVYSLMTKSMTKPIDILMRPYTAMPSNIALLLSCLISWDSGCHCTAFYRVRVTSTAEWLLLHLNWCSKWACKNEVERLRNLLFCCIFFCTAFIIQKVIPLKLTRLLVDWFYLFGLGIHILCVTKILIATRISSISVLEYCKTNKKSRTALARHNI